MGALNYAYCELFKRGENGEGSNCVHPLMTLIDDLKSFNMTREELIYLGAMQLYAAYESNPPKVDGNVLPTRGLIENQALEIAANMYGKLPKYVKYAKK